MKNYSQWNYITFHFDSLHDNFSNSINNKLRKEIELLCDDDQLARSNRKEKNDEDDKGVTEVDSINFIKLKNIISKYGFPGEKLIGESTELTILLLHQCKKSNSKKRNLNYLDSVMKLAVINDQYLAAKYAHWVDFKESFIFRNPLVYGGVFDEIAYGKIRDVKNVDKRRSEIFLVPLGLEVKFFNIIAPKEYKFKYNEKKYLSYIR